MSSVQTMADAAPRRASRPLRVMALSAFPVEAAATRFRISQFVPHLARRGFEVTVLPFLDGRAFGDLYDRRQSVRTGFRLLGSLLRRLFQLPRIVRADVVFVQREAMLFGPPLVEWLVSRLARVPMVLDLDDATWIAVPSPVYGRLATWLKCAWKANRIIGWSRVVICGNETIAAHVRSLGVSAVVLSTIVDPEVFRPRDGGVANAVPVMGWIGTHSTWPYVEALLPVFERLAGRVPFRFRAVGSGHDALELPGVTVESSKWSLEREADDFRGLDVGVYPLAEDEWTAGKSGLKAIEYLCSGVPYVATPAGIAAEIGIPGETHLLARTDEEWLAALESLLRNPDGRRAMAEAGRRYAVEHYSLEAHADAIAEVLRSAVRTR